MAGAFPYVAMVGSTLMQARAQGQSGAATAAAYRIQAENNRKMAEIERQWARYNSSLAIGESQRQAQRIERAGEKFLGKLAPQFAAAGVEMTGSPTDVMAGQISIIQEKKADAITAGRQESEAALYHGELNAWKRLAGASVQEYQAGAATKVARSRQLGTLLGGAWDLWDTGVLGDLFS